MDIVVQTETFPLRKGIPFRLAWRDLRSAVIAPMTLRGCENRRAEGWIYRVSVWTPDGYDRHITWKSIVYSPRDCSGLHLVKVSTVVCETLRRDGLRRLCG